MSLVKKRKQQIFLSQETTKGQTFVNRLIGASIDRPIEIPIKLPPIEMEPKQLREIGMYMMGTGFLIGMGMFFGAMARK